jgi:hypothetical protein
MSAGLKHAWQNRRWFDLPLGLLGVMLMVFGTTFFVFVASVGAPVVPFGGLAIAILGLWIGLVRPLRRRAPPHQSDGAP